MQYNVLSVNLVAPLGIIGVMAISFGWYLCRNKLQMLRPARFEMKNNSRSNRGGFNPPNLVCGIHHAERESRPYMVNAILSPVIIFLLGHVNY